MKYKKRILDLRGRRIGLVPGYFGPAVSAPHRLAPVTFQYLRHSRPKRETFVKFGYIYIHLREVGTLPEYTSRGVRWSKSGFRVRQRGGTWGALGATKQIKLAIGFELIWPLQGPPFLGPGMEVA